MSVVRFLDWFEGFSENIEEAPTPAQWQRIKDKIASLDGTTVELRVTEVDSVASADQKSAPPVPSVPLTEQPPPKFSRAKLRSLKAAAAELAMTNHPDMDAGHIQSAVENFDFEAVDVPSDIAPATIVQRLRL